MEWVSGGTGAAPAYITTSVTLPAAAAGQNVQFKWRVGSDDNTAPPENPGVRIDTITLSTVPTLICGGNTAPAPTSAFSRKVHGAAGTFDLGPLPLNVPLTGAIGIEPRTGVAGEYQIIVNFPSPVTVGGVTVNAGTGSASRSVAGNVVTIDLTGVTDQQRLGLTLSSVSDCANIGSVQIPIGMLAGDVNGNNNVSGTDIGQVKSLVGATITTGNFRADAATNGAISASDVGLVKSKSGNTLP